MKQKHDIKKENKVIALLLSGGKGYRMGSCLPKQYVKVCGMPVIAYCMETLVAHEEIDHIHIVAHAQWHDEIIKCIGKTEKLSGFSIPGQTRQLSILNGLKSICTFAEKTDLVLIHDAARPMLSKKQITACLEAVDGHEGVMPVLSMKDTVYSGDGKRITGLLDRRSVYAGQAPELFRFGTYYQANLDLLPDKILQIKGSTEPAIMAGMDIVMIPGDERNFKITTKEDLKHFESICTAWDR